MNQALRQAVRKVAIAISVGMVIEGCESSVENTSTASAPERKAFAASTSSPASAAGTNDRLVLDTSAQRQLGAHEAAILLLEREQSDQTVCRAMTTASSAQAEVGRSLTNLLRTSLGQQATNDSGIKALEALARQISVQYPGVGLAIGAETVYHFVDFDALATRSPLAVAHTLAQAAKVWPAPAGRPIHWEQITDVSVCTNPLLLAEALSGVNTYWRSAPGCVREQLAQALAEEVRDAVQSRCFCANEASAREGLEQLTRIANAMSLEVPIAAATKHDVAGARFNCR
jgi:hypothetical protein